jgi:LysM repeat protein
VAPASETPSGPRLERCIVRAGETLTAITLSRGTTIGELAAMNGLDNPNFILSGQELVVPVRPGGSQNPPWCIE